MPFNIYTIHHYTELAEYDGNGNEVYHGWAIPGTATSDAKWLIVKFEYNAYGNQVSKKYAGGIPNYDQVWDDRASLNYS